MLRDTFQLNFYQNTELFNHERCISIYSLRNGGHFVQWEMSSGPVKRRLFMALSWNISCQLFNTLRQRQNGRHFTDNIFKCIFLNENVWISIGISLKFVPRSPINNILALVQIMAWRRSGDKPLSEPMMSILLTHICITRPQWVNRNKL